MRYLKLLVALAAFAMPVALATEAEDVAKAYGDAVAAEDWLAAVKHFAPADLGTIRDGFAVVLEIDDARSAFFGGRTPTEIDAMSDEEFVAQVLGSLLNSARAEGVSVTMGSPTVIGSVEETPELVHVVYRQGGTINGGPISMVDVATVSRIGTTWYVALPEEFESVIALLNQ